MKTIVISGRFFFILLLVLWLISPSKLFGTEEAEKSYIRVKTKIASLSVVKGETQVTFESGESKTLMEGESEAALPDGTIISVISGNATLNADKTVLDLQVDDSVLLFIDGTYKTTSIQVPNDYTHELAIQYNGETQKLAAGETYWAPTTVPGKTETKKAKPTTTAASNTKEDKEKEEETTAAPDTSPVEDADTVLEERSPNTPEPPERKPGSNSGQ